MSLFLSKEPFTKVEKEPHVEHPFWREWHPILLTRPEGGPGKKKKQIPLKALTFLTKEAYSKGQVHLVAEISPTLLVRRFRRRWGRWESVKACSRLEKTRSTETTRVLKLALKIPWAMVRLKERERERERERDSSKVPDAAKRRRKKNGKEKTTKGKQPQTKGKHLVSLSPASAMGSLTQ